LLRQSSLDRSWHTPAVTDAAAPSDASIDLDVPGDPPPVSSRGRRGWYWGGGVTLMVAAVAVTLISIGPRHAPHPPPPPSSGPLGWAEALVDGPARGGLAGDPAFATDLPARVTEMLHGTDDPAALYGIDGRWHPDREVRLLFADDVGTLRVAVVALRLPMAEVPTDPPVGAPGLDYDPAMTGNRTKVLSFLGPRGASVSSLVSGLTSHVDNGVLVSSVPAAPFIVDPVSLDGVSANSAIGLAPPGCTVSTASGTDLNTFAPEPTGSYIVRTATTTHAEYWRVTCGGIVREQVLAPYYYHPPTREDVQAALASAAGLQPGDTQNVGVQEAVSGGLTELAQRGSDLTAAPQVIWAGMPQIDRSPINIRQPFALITSAPTAPSGWLVAASVWDIGGGHGRPLDGALISTTTDPATTTVAALVQGSQLSRVFVLAPPSAHGVRLQTADGSLVRDVALTTRVAVLARSSDPTRLVVQAYNETGTPIGPPAPVLAAAPAPDAIHDWSGPATAG
jgi:hypothetical protein